jgi:hypothetical protein
MRFILCDPCRASTSIPLAGCGKLSFAQLFGEGHDFTGCGKTLTYARFWKGTTSVVPKVVQNVTAL